MDSGPSTPLRKREINKTFIVVDLGQDTIFKNRNDVAPARVPNIYNLTWDPNNSLCNLILPEAPSAFGSFKGENTQSIASHGKRELK